MTDNQQEAQGSDARARDQDKSDGPDISVTRSDSGSSPLVRAETERLRTDNAIVSDTRYYLSAHGWAVILVTLGMFVVIGVMFALVAAFVPDLIQAVEQLAEAMRGI